MTELVSIKQLADRLGLDRSNARRYVLGLGYEFKRMRTADSRNQATLCLSLEDADIVVSRRKADGYLGPTVITSPDSGVFYVIQLVPELSATRVKLGYTNSLEERLGQHRTAAPTAIVVGSWACKRAWEVCAMDALTRVGCRLVANGVFECDTIEALTSRGDAFFQNMPKPGDRVPMFVCAEVKS
jgi:hypothetical protein